MGWEILSCTEDIVFPQQGESYYVDPSGETSNCLVSGLQKFLDFATDPDLLNNRTHLLITSNVETDPNEIFNLERIHADIVEMKKRGVSEFQLARLEGLYHLLNTQPVNLVFVKSASMRQGLADYVKKQPDSTVHPGEVLQNENIPGGILVMNNYHEFNLLKIEGFLVGYKELYSTDSYGRLFHDLDSALEYGYNNYELKNSCKRWYLGSETIKTEELVLFIRGIWDTSGKMVVVCNPPETAQSFIKKMQSVFQEQKQSHTSLHQGKKAGFESRFNAMTVSISNSCFLLKDQWYRSAMARSAQQEESRFVFFPQGPTSQPHIGGPTLHYNSLKP